jgi:hypothetical protein
VETIVADALLGADGIHADGVEPWTGDATGGDASAPVPPGDRSRTWWCAAPVLGCPRAQPLSNPVPRKREQSLHTCAQDVQITRMATI